MAVKLSDKKIAWLKTIPILPHQKFHALTRSKTNPSRLKKTVPQKLLKKLKRISFKEYPNAARYPFEIQTVGLSLQQCLEERQSTRTFSGEPLTVSQIGTLLHFGGGVKTKNASRRFYPSAGARYPLEMYVISLNSKLPQGVYHYNVRDCLLEQAGLFPEKFKPEAYFSQEWVHTAGCVIAVTGIFDRTAMKYGERSYRYALIEAGHIIQNLSLAASALQLGGCTIGGFDDDRINDLLGVDGVGEAALCLFAAGSR